MFWFKISGSLQSSDRHLKKAEGYSDNHNNDNNQHKDEYEQISL